MNENKLRVLYMYCRTGRYESEDLQEKERKFNDFLNKIETNYEIKQKELSISR